MQPHIPSLPIAYLKGVSAIRADLLHKELNVSSYHDLLHHFPYRHVDKTKVDEIAALAPGQDYAFIAATLKSVQIVGEGRAKRLVAIFADHTGAVEAVWFQGIQWVQKILLLNKKYFLFGRLGFFMGKPQMAHPDIENYQPAHADGKPTLEPVYASTEKLKARYITAAEISKMVRQVLSLVSEKDYAENIPASIIEHYKLMPRFEALQQIHFPKSSRHFDLALRRLKFEELFIAQVRIQLVKLERHRFSKGYVFDKVGHYFNSFFNDHLPFKLTNAQKRVVKEIRADVGTGRQMNRLVQGDVGSGKTVVALMCMLIAADNGFQSVLMAPTETLARQHFESLSTMLHGLDIKLSLLTGSIKGKQRKQIFEGVEAGELHILVGTHAVIEDKVVFKNLGFAVIDEQHKFGVAQRARLWKKNTLPPHVLVMTATPIPRTLALTAYGDLDYSVMDELPPGRSPVITRHYPERHRPEIMRFVGGELAKGRQAYFIYPLIEESSTLDYENLMKGYEEVKSFFPEPRYYISMVHGKQDPSLKDTNMQRFMRNDTQIMVSTTVIEVGVNVPNASIMVIESAERFGLSQLHQLRGRVGRGSEQSYCFLLTGKPPGKEAKERMNIMCATNDGFLIAEKDLELRGPGEIEGTKQSGALNFRLASIVQDRSMLEAAKDAAAKILIQDEGLQMPENKGLKEFLAVQTGKTRWSKIS